MMDQDTSDELEASLCVIQYHCLMIKEIEPESNLPLTMLGLD